MGAHRFHVLRETEGAGARDVSLVAARSHVEADALPAGGHRRVVELDLEGQHITVVRFELGPLQCRALAFADLHLLLDADEALGRVLQLDARALQQVDEAGGRAVEHRHLFAADVDDDVVQTEACARRQQVLDGLHLGPAGVAAGADGRRHARVADRLGRHRNAHRLRQIDAAKDDAAVHRRRSEGQLDLLPAMHAQADGAGDGLEGALLEHGELSRSRRAAAGHRFNHLDKQAQSACLRRNAGISISSMPLLASASTFAAACVRALRQTLGVASWL